MITRSMVHFFDLGNLDGLISGFMEIQKSHVSHIIHIHQLEVGIRPISLKAEFHVILEILQIFMQDEGKTRDQVIHGYIAFKN